MKPIFIVFWVILGLISAHIATKRGKNPYFWFAMGLVFGIFGLLALFLFVPKKIQPPVVVREENPKPSFFFQEENTEKLWYYVNKSNEQIGPISFGALSKLWEEEKISSSTYLWNEAWASWKKIEDLLTNSP
ncbi:MAG: DUF4339 domain-containing protein [Chlamydiota bacterium]